MVKSAEPVGLIPTSERVALVVELAAPRQRVAICSFFGMNDERVSHVVSG